MGFLSTSVGMTRYRIVEEDIPSSLWVEIDERLRGHAFRDIDASAEERSFGWVSFENMLDADFVSAPPEKGQYLAFVLRLDTRRIPPAVVKKHLTIAMNEARQGMQEQGKKFMTKEQKLEIRDQVVLRLRARTLPIPACFDVLWDTMTNNVYLASVQPKLLELFEELFTHTFGLHLEPLTPYFLARQYLEDTQWSALDDLQPTIFATGEE